MITLSMQQQPKWTSSNGRAMYQVHLKESISLNCNRHPTLPADPKMKSTIAFIQPPPTHPPTLLVTFFLSTLPVLEKNISHHTLYMRLITYPLAHKIEAVHCIFGGHFYEYKMTLTDVMDRFVLHYSNHVR